MKRLNSIIALAVAVAIPAFAQQDKMLPGEDTDQASVMFETITQMQGGVVANAARVRAQQREIERLNGEVKSLKEKCGDRCEEPKKQ